MDEREETVICQRCGAGALIDDAIEEDWWLIDTWMNGKAVGPFCHECELEVKPQEAAVTQEELEELVGAAIQLPGYLAGIPITTWIINVDTAGWYAQKSTW